MFIQHIRGTQTDTLFTIKKNTKILFQRNQIKRSDIRIQDTIIRKQFKARDERRQYQPSKSLQVSFHLFSKKKSGILKSIRVIHPCPIAFEAINLNREMTGDHINHQQVSKFLFVKNLTI